MRRLPDIKRRLLTWRGQLRGLTVARRGLGLFYLAMAWRVNVFVTLPKAEQVMAGFTGDAWLPLYRDLLAAVVVPHAVAVTVATIGFETALGVAMLVGSHRTAAWAVLGGAAWCTALLPVLVWPYIAPMPPLIAVQLWLFARLRRASRSTATPRAHATGTAR